MVYRPEDYTALLAKRADPKRAINMRTDEEPVLEWIAHAIEHARKKQAYSEATGNNIPSRTVFEAGRPEKGLSFAVTNDKQLRSYATTQEDNDTFELNDIRNLLSRSGSYSSYKDELRLEPKYSTFELAAPDGIAGTLNRKELIKELLGTLRHEASHREQAYNTMDNAIPIYNNSGNLGDTDEISYYDNDGYDTEDILDKLGVDPRIQLRFMTSTDWNDLPTEWIAVADQIGYLLRKYGIKDNIQSDIALVNEINNLSPASTHNMYYAILNAVHSEAKHIPNISDKEVSNIQKKVAHNWLNRVRQSYDIGEDTNISDIRTKNIITAIRGTI